MPAYEAKTYKYRNPRHWFVSMIEAVVDLIIAVFTAFGLSQDNHVRNQRQARKAKPSQVSRRRSQKRSRTSKTKTGARY